MSQDAILTVLALPTPTLLIGPDERIEAINSAARALFGHDGTGRHYITVLRQPATLEAIERTLTDRQPPRGAISAGREAVTRRGESSPVRSSFRAEPVFWSASRTSPPSRRPARFAATLSPMSVTSCARP
ncbi:hypothetical protein ruthe_00955 [Rubellimicrobium thermophilum DSM 16684]|uniref:PAS fold protein n=1 Tax=Rubellimicrobium thermophilum DSM 16684 TaxID=1123069 RepID=S9QXS3_9RHOB|nr:hypothetical protein ruthe_00955 [Rubellimicrobium thermophilum DSM 16684]